MGFSLNVKLYKCLCVFIVILSFSCLKSFDAKSRENCLPFLPHGYNNFFVHLPKEKNFCVETPDGKVFYSTNANGARIIHSVKSDLSIHAFGESQLLEIFPVNNKPKHLLSYIYGDRKFLIHGAPNNGPNETLAFINYIMSEKNKPPEEIVIGLNLGFDLFRIIPGWKTADRVPYESNQIPFMMDYPKLFEIINVSKAFFTNKLEIVSPINQIKKSRSYFKQRKVDIITYFNYWLENIKKIKLKNNINIDLIIYQPFWVYDIEHGSETLVLDKYFEKEVLEIFCNARNTYANLFRNVFYFSFDKKMTAKEIFSFSYRHYKYRHPQIIKNNSICENS